MLLQQPPPLSSANSSSFPRIRHLPPSPASLLSKGFPNPRCPGLRPLPYRLTLRWRAFTRSNAEAVEGEPLAAASEAESREEMGSESAGLNVGIGRPAILDRLGLYRMSLGDQAFFLLAFIACTTSAAFTSFIIAAIPTLVAMKRAAISLAKLADTAREELPSTMAAIRLSGMEISDLTMELNDLSQDVADVINKSAQTVQAAEAGIRQIGALARRQTVSMIQERANLPDISLKPMVTGAARKTSHGVGQAKRTLMNIFSRAKYGSDSEDVSDSAEI